MNVSPQSNITLTSLCRSLTNGEFFYFYQPLISLESGMICGAEALIRWKRADGALVMPADFIPLAESTGFITEMNQELLPLLMDDLSRIDALSPETFVHFNLSTADLQTADLEPCRRTCATSTSPRAASGSRSLRASSCPLSRAWSRPSWTSPRRVSRSS